MTVANTAAAFYVLASYIVLGRGSLCLRRELMDGRRKAESTATDVDIVATVRQQCHVICLANRINC